MESHPSVSFSSLILVIGVTCELVKYPPLSAVIKRYPHAASTIFQTYNDLLLAQQWSELEIVDLPVCGRCGFMGRRPESRNIQTFVVPCMLAETISMVRVQRLGHPSEVFLAISAEDSSIVYYKLSMGINKPPV
ncbi:hypothetical protein BGW80DRAFT_1163385 [Lactifluus volemus]|nr:hypothetical protein BGW80DRAFT_1163385 [Lactifluus volemus]